MSVEEWVASAVWKDEREPSSATALPCWNIKR